MHLGFNLFVVLNVALGSMPSNKIRRDFVNGKKINRLKHLWDIVRHLMINSPILSRKD